MIFAVMYCKWLLCLLCALACSSGFNPLDFQGNYSATSNNTK